MEQILRYADDTGLIASNVTTSKRMLFRVDTSGKENGLGLNAPKTKYMHIKGKQSQPDEFTTIKVNGTLLEKVDTFKYLEICLQHIKTRIAMAKQKMVQLNNVWKDRSNPNQLKMFLLKCFV